jgi:hypothetical protein
MIRLEDAKKLIPGQILFCVKFKNLEGRPVPCVVCEEVKTWKRDPSKLKIPIKHGHRDFVCLTENDLGLLFLTEAEAIARGQ